MLAKTLTIPSGLPIAEFAGYGKLGTIQSGWAIFILFWHALHSVLYPILLTDWMFPAAGGPAMVRHRAACGGSSIS